MSDNPTLDQLTNIRGELEQEVADIRNLLAGRQKVLESLNSTISLLRGWSQSDLADTATSKRSSPRRYDDDAMAGAISDLFLSARGNARFTMKEISAYLLKLDLIPDESNGSRSKINAILNSKLKGAVELEGFAHTAQWKLSSAVTSPSK